MLHEEAKSSSQVEKACESLSVTVENYKSALNELIYFKENVFKEYLPKEPLTEMEKITSRLFQSVSNFEEPLNELVNYIQVSSSKDDKTMALHKLQDSYDKKCRQLDIALRQLARCSTQMEKLSKERRIQNWEKLFLCALANKSLVRQWRFRIPQILENAGKGKVHFSAYISNLIEENQTTSLGSNKR